MSDGRTEPATPKRRREARRKGQVARSVELSQALGLVTAVLVLPSVMPALTNALRTNWERSAALAGNAEPGTSVAFLGRFLSDTALALVPLIAALAIGGVVAGVAMVGAKPNMHQLKPKWSHLSPKHGIKRLASKQTLWELGKTTLKLTVLALVGWFSFQAASDALSAAPLSLAGLVDVMSDQAGGLLMRVTLFAALIGVADAVISKRRNMKQLRMTKHEVTEEHKQSEGNPQVKGEIRKKQMKLSRSRMIAAVANADVILTNPTHLAVALSYEQGASAPVVVAKGAGAIADRIRAEALKHGVPIRENKPLARALFRSVDIGDAIPVALYRAVAEVLAAIYRARRRAA